MFGKKQIDVLVVGAGPIGMATALQLARHGVRVALIDQAPNPCTRSNALVLSPTSLALFHELGLASELLDHSFRIERVQVYDEAQKRESIRLTELDSAFPYAAAVPQSRLESVLEEALSEAGAEVHWNHRLDTIEQSPSGVVARTQRLVERSMGYAVPHTERMVDREIEFHARLLIAADGFGSGIANRIDAGRRAMGDPQRFVFFDFESDSLSLREMLVSFAQDLAVAQYPMSGGMIRLAFQFDGLVLPEDYRTKEREPLPRRFDPDGMLGDKRLSQLIKSRAPWNAGYVNRVHWRSAAEFPLTMVDRPLVGHVFLLGDAARTFGPVGMTSINLGLLESQRLAHAVSKYLRHPDLTQQLAALANDFKADWESLYALQDHSRPLEMADPWVTARRGKILESLPVAGDTLERLANQLFIHLTHSQTALA